MEGEEAGRAGELLAGGAALGRHTAAGDPATALALAESVPLAHTPHLALRARLGTKSQGSGSYAAWG